MHLGNFLGRVGKAYINASYTGRSYYLEDRVNSRIALKRLKRIKGNKKVRVIFNWTLAPFIPPCGVKRGRSLLFIAFTYQVRWYTSSNGNDVVLAQVVPDCTSIRVAAASCPGFPGGCVPYDRNCRRFSISQQASPCRRGDARRCADHTSAGAVVVNICSDSLPPGLTVMRVWKPRQGDAS